MGVMLTNLLMGRIWGMGRGGCQGDFCISDLYTLWGGGAVPRRREHRKVVLCLGLGLLRSPHPPNCRVGCQVDSCVSRVCAQVLWSRPCQWASYLWLWLLLGWHILPRDISVLGRQMQKRRTKNCLGVCKRCLPRGPA